METKPELFQYIANHIIPEESFLNELNRETHLRCLYPRMISGHLQGKLLYMLCKMINPKRVLELGTFTGYSAINMGLALNSDALLHTIEINDELAPMILKYIQKAGLQNKIILHIGDALELIPTLDELFDLVFIDANKRDYPAYYELVFNKVRPGGYIIADNTLWDGKVIDKNDSNDMQTKGIMQFNEIVKNDSRVEAVILPLRDGMSLIRKK